MRQKLIEVITTKRDNPNEIVQRRKVYTERKGLPIWVSEQITWAIRNGCAVHIAIASDAQVTPTKRR